MSPLDKDLKEVRGAICRVNHMEIWRKDIPGKLHIDYALGVKGDYVCNLL